MTNDHIAETVKAYILGEFLPGEKPDALKESTPLISGGILDSISTIKLVSYLEEKYSIEFEAHEMNAEHLDTISKIVELVDAKVAEK